MNVNVNEEPTVKVCFVDNSCQKIPRVAAVEWKTEGHRKRGRPKMTWRRTVEAEAIVNGLS